MKELICWDNIVQLEAQVRQNLNNFTKLREAQLKRKEQGYEQWKITAPAKETYNILRLSFCR